MAPLLAIPSPPECLILNMPCTRTFISMMNLNHPRLPVVVSYHASDSLASTEMSSGGGGGGRRQGCLLS